MMNVSKIQQGPRRESCTAVPGEAGRSWQHLPVLEGATTTPSTGLLTWLGPRSQLERSYALECAQGDLG